MNLLTQILLSFKNVRKDNNALPQIYYVGFSSSQMCIYSYACNFFQKLYRAFAEALICFNKAFNKLIRTLIILRQQNKSWSLF